MTDPAVADAIAKMQQRLQAIQQNQQQAQQRFAQLDGMRAEIAAISASASSPDREVTVTAGPGGSVSAVRIDDDALRLGGEALGKLVTGTIKQAVAEAARQQAEVVQHYVGDQFDVTGRVRAAQEQAFSGGWRAGGPAGPQPGTAENFENSEDNDARDLLADRRTPAPRPRHARPAAEDSADERDWLYDGGR